MGVQSWDLYIIGVVVIEWATHYHYGFAYKDAYKVLSSACIAPKTADTDSHGWNWSGQFSDLI